MGKVKDWAITMSERVEDELASQTTIAIIKAILIREYHASSSVADAIIAQVQEETINDNATTRRRKAYTSPRLFQ